MLKSKDLNSAFKHISVFLFYLLLYFIHHILNCFAANECIKINFCIELLRKFLSNTHELFRTNSYI
ncbi:hypothetical protein MPC4_820002 [Methylocella tundrae]|uniref:Uncharacterized protein n=1 Tax=Methylocella tundrae TaxID=227605 RepID=A0A8B6MBY9_METTU|nr:hypothetical protein MPC4_820002 [Methylocella tundrae]